MASTLMGTKSARPNDFRERAACAMLIALSCATTAFAQGTPPQGTYPQYPQPSTYPPMNASPSAAVPYGAPQPMRNLFAASLAQMAQATGSGAAVAVADGLTGALRDWFDRRRQRATAYPRGAAQYGPAPNVPYSTGPYGTGANPAPAGYPSTPDSSYPNPGASSYPQTPDAYPNDGSQNSVPYPANYPPTATQQYPDSQSSTGQSQLYAGFAYEIHLLGVDGTTTPVDPMSYAFRTGDQFRVYYRPALPGRVDVFNVNAAGQNAQIDAVNVAAGELVTLGPYQFTDLTGEETLILRLSACTTPTLLATTRNIVKVQGASASSPQIASCSDVVTRGLKAKTKTRDIRKVSVEGGTSFALDAVGADELQSGQYAPRQVTITLHHR